VTIEIKNAKISLPAQKQLPGSIAARVEDYFDSRQGGEGRLKVRIARFQQYSGRHCLLYRAMRRRF
jgi:hypothetical protein